MSERTLINGDFMEFGKQVTWMSCCDCGLAHAFVLSAAEAGSDEPVLFVYRDDHLTLLNRKNDKAKLKRQLKKILEEL